MVTNTRPPPGKKPAPPANPPHQHAQVRCQSCGSSDFATRGANIVCTYCRGLVGAAPRLIEVTNLHDEAPRYVSAGREPPSTPPPRYIKG